MDHFAQRGAGVLFAGAQCAEKLTSARYVSNDGRLLLLPLEAEQKDRHHALESEHRESRNSEILQQSGLSS